MRCLIALTILAACSSSSNKSAEADKSATAVVVASPFLGALQKNNSLPIEGFGVLEKRAAFAFAPKHTGRSGKRFTLFFRGADKRLLDYVAKRSNQRPAFRCVAAAEMLVARDNISETEAAVRLAAALANAADQMRNGGTATIDGLGVFEYIPVRDQVRFRVAPTAEATLNP